MAPASSSVEDKRKIRQRLALQLRGVDRMDRALVAAAFHDDAATEHGSGFGEGGSDRFADYVVTVAQPKYHAAMHYVTNSTVDFDDRDPSRALVKTNLAAVHVHTDAPSTRLDWWAGRFVDRWERRDGLWRVAQRVVVHDWHDAVRGAAGAEWMFRLRPGTRDRDDVVYLDAPEHDDAQGRIGAAKDESQMYAALCRGVRGLEIGDATLACSAFDREGTISIAAGVTVPVREVIGEYLEEVRRTYDWCSIIVSNFTLSLVEDQVAHTEAYFDASFVHSGGTGIDRIGGRLVDWWRRTDGEWRVLERRVVREWTDHRNREHSGPQLWPVAAAGPRAEPNGALATAPSDAPLAAADAPTGSEDERAALESVFRLLRALDEGDRDRIRALISGNAVLRNHGQKVDAVSILMDVVRARQADHGAAVHNLHNPEMGQTTDGQMLVAGLLEVASTDTADRDPLLERMIARMEFLVEARGGSWTTTEISIGAAVTTSQATTTLDSWEGRFREGLTCDTATYELM